MVFRARCIVRSIPAQGHRRLLQLPGADTKSNTSANLGLAHLVNACARRSDPERRIRILALSGRTSRSISVRALVTIPARKQLLGLFARMPGGRCGATARGVLWHLSFFGLRRRMFNATQLEHHQCNAESSVTVCGLGVASRQTLPLTWLL